MGDAIQIRWGDWYFTPNNIDVQRAVDGHYAVPGDWCYEFWSSRKIVPLKETILLLLRAGF